MSGSKRKELSLLPDSENASSPIARALKWATTAGRYVIVFTELIVIGAFISRFWLDRKNSDLSEVIRQQKAILESTKSFENEFTLLQQRLDFIKQSYATTPQYDRHIKSLAESLPPDIIYESIILSKSEDKNGDIKTLINLSSFTEEPIVNFISNLIANPDISSIDVKNIEKKDKENKYIVNIEVVFKTHTND